MECALIVKELFVDMLLTCVCVFVIYLTVCTCIYVYVRVVWGIDES